ncbi:MAG: tyrosine-type recombinase/integrase [Pseudomonadota bacterium]
MATLYKRGRIWWGRFQLDGRERRRSLKTTHRAEAKKRLAAWEDSERLKAIEPEAGNSWAKACQRYVEEVMPSSVRPQTAKRYLVSYRQVMDIIGAKPINQIGRQDILAIANRKGPSVATRKRDLTAVSQVFRAAVVWGWCDRNPVREFDSGAVMKERRDPIVLPTDEEIEQFITACPPALALMARLLLLTGLRLSEAASLKWSQVSTDGPPQLRIVGKRNRLRMVPMSAQAVGTISECPRHIHAKVVFWHGNGQPYTQASTQFALIRRRLGITWRTHDLRHRFAVDYLKAGGSIYRLKEILGHTQVSTTEIYLAHVTPEEAERAKGPYQRGTGTSPTLSTLPLT